MAGLTPFAGRLIAGDGGTAPQPEPQNVARERIRKRYFPDVVLRTQGDRKVRFY